MAEIEIVRGRMSASLSEEVLAFWTQDAGFTGPAAQGRLAQVVCVVRRGGGLVGVSSVYPARLPMTGKRTFWAMRSRLATGAEDARDPLLSATFAALDAEATGAPDEPLGLCVLVADDPAERRRRPELQWADPPLLYAGYLPDGGQVRLGYFAAQRAVLGRLRADGRPHLEAGYRVMAYAGQSEVGAEDILALWTAEAGLPAAEAQRRLSEVLVVAIGPDRRLVGVYTGYVAPHEQLRCDMWHFRLFVRAAHRNSGIGLSLAMAARDLVRERRRRGEEDRGRGIVYVIQSDYLNATYPQPVWLPMDFTLIAQTPGRGYPVLIHPFPGADTPEP